MRGEVDERNEEAEAGMERANREIEWGEMIKAVKSMKKAKAAGEDGMVAEFLKGIPEEGLRELREILNHLWVNGEIGKGWEIGRIYPIYKAGEIGDAANYRGITLLNTGYKLLATIITARLREWIETNGVLKESQAGFRSGRGTRDHVFVLNSLINNQLKKKGGKLYTAFVDFKAAFDTVDRDLLLDKMEKMGVSGRLLKMIEKIYNTTTNEVITGEGVTRRFTTVRGVRQGCPISPTLFSMFIEDMDEVWERKNEGGTVIGGEKIFAMKFADDIVLVANEEDGLRSMLGSLEKYVERNKLTVNIDKTKILIFKKGGRNKKSEKWKYNNKELERVTEYKYLGVWFSTGNTFEKHIKILTGKINKVINATWGIFKRAKIGSLKRRLYLMEAIAKSGMLYGVEIWGWKNRAQVERLQARYVKMAMGVNRNTPNYIWRMEAGCRGIGIEIWKRAAKYLREVMEMGDERWPKKCLKEEVRGIINGNPTKWGAELTKAMNDIGEGDIWQGIRNGDIAVIEEKIERGIKIRTEQEIQYDWNKIDRSAYCKEYQGRKISFQMEEYWEDREIAGEIKEIWARIRCGNVGKQGNKGHRDQKCSFCRNEIEDLKHICECTAIKAEIKNEIVNELEIWCGSAKGETLKQKINECLKGKPTKELTNYIKQFEIIVKRRNENA